RGAGVFARRPSGLHKVKKPRWKTLMTGGLTPRRRLGRGPSQLAAWRRHTTHFLPCGLFSCRYHMPSVQEGLGGGHCVVRCRQGQKGGRWRCGEGKRVLPYGGG